MNLKKYVRDDGIVPGGAAPVAGDGTIGVVIDRIVGAGVVQIHGSCHREGYE